LQLDQRACPWAVLPLRASCRLRGRACCREQVWQMRARSQDGCRGRHHAYSGHRGGLESGRGVPEVNVSARGGDDGMSRRPVGRRGLGDHRADALHSGLRDHLGHGSAHVSAESSNELDAEESTGLDRGLGCDHGRGGRGRGDRILRNQRGA
jgi:hypothetical protein